MRKHKIGNDQSILFSHVQTKPGFHKAGALIVMGLRRIKPNQTGHVIVISLP